MEHDWTDVYDDSNPDTAYNKFIDPYKRIYDEAFPIKKKKIIYRNSKPWLTIGLINSIKKKNVLYKKFLRTKLDVDKETFRQYRNKLHHLLKIAERRFHTANLFEAKNNMKKTWKILKTVIGTSKQELAQTEFRNANGKNTDPVSIANEFNIFFSSIGITLANKIPPTQHTFRDYLPPNLNENFLLSPIVKKEIIDVVNGLASNKGPGSDDILPKVIKNSVNIISSPLLHIFNSSFITGVVPDKLKTARVIPIFKSGDKDMYCNYRPMFFQSP